MQNIKATIITFLSQQLNENIPNTEDEFDDMYEKYFNTEEYNYILNQQFNEQFPLLSGNTTLTMLKVVNDFSQGIGYDQITEILNETAEIGQHKLISCYAYIFIKSIGDDELKTILLQLHHLSQQQTHQHNNTQQTQPKKHKPQNVNIHHTMKK